MHAAVKVVKQCQQLDSAVVAEKKIRLGLAIDMDKTKYLD